MKNMLNFVFAILAISFMGCASVQQQAADIQNTSQVNKDKPDQNTGTPELGYKELFGDVKIKTLRAQLSDGRPWYELAISNKGEIFGFAPGNNGKPGELIVCDLNTAETQSIYSAPNDFGIIFFKYNDNYLAWTEVHNFDLSSPRVVVYDREKKRTTVVSEKIQLPTGISYEMIALGDDFLLWSTGEKEQDNLKYKIMKYDFASQNISEFQKNATMPIIGEDFIAWLGPADEKMKYSAIYYYNLKDNSINKIITPGQHPTYINTDGTSIVFIGVSDTDSFLKTLSIYENGNIQIIKKSKSDNFDFPEISQSFVGWRGTTKLSVYSRKDAKIGILTEEFADYTEVKVSDKYIMWHSPVIKDEYEAKLKAMEQNVYLSDLHVISKEDIV